MITKLEENNTVKIKELETNFPEVFKNGAIKKDFKESKTDSMDNIINRAIMDAIN